MNPEYLGLQTILTTHMSLSGALVAVDFCLQAAAAHSVYLIGEMTDWQATPMAMQRDAKGIWRITLRLRHGQWLYKFIVDGKIIADPENPLKAADGLGGFHSYLLIGDGDWAQRAETAYGEIIDLSLYSHFLQENTQFQLYLPPNYQKNGRYSLLYLMHGYRTEGNQWATNGRICQFMGNLQAQGLIEPFIIVLPGTVQQEKAEQYGQFLIGPLYEWLCKHFAIAPGAANTAIAGMSQFSLNAFDLAQQSPQRFGFSAPISAFFSQRYLAELGQADAELSIPANFVLRLYCGSEDYVFARNQQFADILRRNGLHFDYLRVNGEHSWHYWNSITRELLIAVSEFFSGHQALSAQLNAHLPPNALSFASDQHGATVASATLPKWPQAQGAADADFIYE